MPEAASSPLLQIALFGQCRLVVDGSPWKLNMARLTLPLLACLLINRERPLARDYLAFTLWPEDDEEAARANLRRYLYQLQRTLPRSPDRPWLIVEGESVQWNPDAPAWLDVAEFEERCDDDRDLESAVDLYVGDLVENLYDDWLIAERERLRQRCLYALTTLVERYRHRLDYNAALLCARRLLALDPWREDMIREVMRLHYEAGNGAGALAEYRRFAERLRAEMNVDPMPETAALRGLIARNAPLGETPRSTAHVSTAPPAHASLPFVGRDRERELLRMRWERAARGFGGMTLIGGEAGIGKSRLATEAAHEVERAGGRVLCGATSSPERLPYQALIESLHTAYPLVAAADIEPVWLAILARVLPEFRSETLQPPSVSTVDPEREQLRFFEALTVCFTALARPRPLLLVLEDVHWAGTATMSAVHFIARRAARARILILATYREEEAERAHPLRLLRRDLAGDDGFAHLALPRLSVEDVRALVARRSELAQDENLPVSLHTQSEGNPLFLRELVADLTESRRTDVALANDVLPSSGIASQPPSGIRSIIAARTARLSPAAHAVAEIAAVAGQGFTLDVVREVSGWSEAQILDAVDELLDRHLVREVGRGHRFDHAFTHNLIQASMYGEIPEHVRARRHRRIANVLEDVYYDRLDEMALELAMHHERGGAPQRAAERYARAAEHAFDVYANDDALDYARRGLGLVSGEPLRTRLVRLRERVHRRLGNRAEQLRDLEELDRLIVSRGDPELENEIVWQRIHAYRTLGDRERELASIAELRTRGNAPGHELWAARARQEEATLDFLMGNVDTANERATEALALHEALGDREGQVESLCLLANISSVGGTLSETRALLERARSVAKSARNESSIARATMAASRSALLTQDFISSEQLAGEALDLYRAIGDREGEADALARIAAALGRCFHIERARKSYDEARELYTGIGKRLGVAAVLVNSGLLAFHIGQMPAALDAYEAAARQFEALGDLRGQIVCAANRSVARLYSGDAAQAKADALRALKLAESTRDPALLAIAFGNLGTAERDLGDVAAGIAHINESLTLRSAAERPVDVLDDLADLALAYLDRGNLASARSTAERLSAAAADANELHYWPWRWHWVAAQVFQACREDGNAAKYVRLAHTLLHERAERVVDADARATFFALPFNRELSAAHECGRWPARVARFAANAEETSNSRA